MQKIVSIVTISFFTTYIQFEKAQIIISLLFSSLIRLAFRRKRRKGYNLAFYQWTETRAFYLTQLITPLPVWATCTKQTLWEKISYQAPNDSAPFFVESQIRIKSRIPFRYHNLHIMISKLKYQDLLTKALMQKLIYHL